MTYHSDKRPLGQSAFTLVEIIVVITLMGLMLALVPVYIANSLPSSELRASARELSSTIRMARSLALARGVPQMVNVKLGYGGFELVGNGAKPFPTGVAAKVIDPVYGERSEGIWPIYFDQGGRSAGGTIVLFNDKKAIYITLDPVVGSVVLNER